LALRILAIATPELEAKLDAYRASIAEQVEIKNQSLKKSL
jgi:phosphoribosylcarboxyaminoimidazole (NCAIR) mutase